MLQILPHLLGNLHPHSFLRLVRGASDVGGEDDILHSLKGRVLQGLFVENVESRGRHLTLFQGLHQIDFVQQLSACAIHQTNAFFHFLDCGSVDHARGLRRQAHMQSDVIRRSIDLVEAGAANPEFLGDGHRDERIVGYQLHSKGPGASCHFHTDAAKADNSKCLAAKLRTLQRFLFPLSGMHEGIGAAKMASHAQHHPESLFRYRHGICPGRVHYGDALACRRIQIDVVHPHAGPPDHAQFLGMRQQSGVRLDRGAHDQCVGGLQFGREFALDLVRGKNLPARFSKLVNRRCGDFFRYNNFHGCAHPFLKASLANQPLTFDDKPLTDI